MTKFVKTRLAQIQEARSLGLNGFTDKIKAKAATLGVSSAAIGAMLASGSANAAIDVTAATAAVADAQTAALAVLAAMLALAVAIWGLRKIIGMFGRG